MKNHRTPFALLALFACFALPLSTLAQNSQPAPVPAVDMSVQSPESVGFSAERLERLHAYMQKEVDDKQFAGIVTLARAPWKDRRLPRRMGSGIWRAERR